MNLAYSLRRFALLVICLATLALAAACGSTEPTTTGPSEVPSPAPAPAPSPSPSPTPPPAPSGPGALEISINPNPVPWDSNAVSGCDGTRPNRWHWDQVLRNTGGSRITLTERVNYLNGGEFSRVGGFTISIDPGQTHTQATAICSAVNDDQTFRTDWSGSDAGGTRIAVTGPNVRLLKR